MLEEQEAHRREELEKYDDEPALSDRKDEAESEGPVIERFFQENGNRAIHKMTVFTLLEFNAIWNQLKDHVTRN